MGQLFSDVEIEPVPVAEEVVRYRRMSPFAVASLIFGVMSLIGLFAVQDAGPLAYAVVPALATLTGLMGLRAVIRYDELGKTPARIGLAVGAICLAGAWPLKAWLDANEAPPGYIPIRYEMLQKAENAKENVPEEAKKLDGQRVFIKGFVYPGRETKGVKEFVLCRDNGTCCFGGQPKLNDMIQVKLKEPLALDYDTTMRHLGGTFRVKTDSASEGLGMVLYQLEADYLK